MKKKTLYLLIALMSFSLIGIIWVQAYWINNGIQVKEAQFDQLVNDALNDVVIDFEDSESVNFIGNQIASISSNVVSEKDTIQHKTTTTIKQWVNQRIVVDSDSTENSFNYEMITEENGSGMEMKISINGETQIIEITNQLENLEEILDSSKIFFSGAKEKVFGNRFGNLIIKMAKEFKDIENPIEHLLKDLVIEPIIENKLADNGISTSFKYAVINDNKIMDAFSSDDFEISEENYTVNLFKHNLFENSAQLALDFNGKNRYVLKSMWLMISSSILFTLIILLTFSSTIYYMIKQKKLSEMKNDFINNMTHEFKTPISTISLAIDSITHPKVIKDEKQINHFAGIIREENLRMNKQVESVLTTALGEKDELEFDQDKIDLNELIQKIPSRMKLQLDAHNATLNLNLTTEKLMLLADEMHLQNAICNLIDNSTKYNTNNPEITIDTNLVNGFCEIKITDNGIGMSNETQKKVFDKFYRVEKGNIHTVKGFGIGLSYVKTIVDAHKGSIALKSKLKQGTIITINIPTV
ncbi:MAG: HAMP domain-containing histidine kinase [Flavobacteriales bacterium]|nr:HAMP domain-containing histidine kinase [Flavobacteriales bacterium]NQX96764.1 HAMP domain-containing histidine kinase [Flavobacteriales bacterium]